MFQEFNPKVYTPVLITLILMVAAFVGLGSFNSKPNLALGQTSHEENSAFEKLLKPVLTKPVRLTIDSLETTLRVNPVGIENDGSLETPKSWNEAGWYKNGAMPGQTGNVLINAHYDDNLGKPAAFWQLKNIKIGDKVVLENEFGKVYTYEVTEFFYIDIRDPERLKIFKDTKGKSTITLITCGGVWLPGESTYNKRLVVKGELSPEVGR